MKKIGIIALFLALMIGIGVLEWLSLIFCLNCFGTLPMFVRF